MISGGEGITESASVLQNDVKTLKKWMADVDVFLNEEWPALGDSEALEKQLEQCTVREHTRSQTESADLMESTHTSVEMLGYAG